MQGSKIEGRDTKTIIQDVLEAAQAGLVVIRSGCKPVAVTDDLRCAQCESLLYEPTTLEDGVTVCLPCMRKYRDGVEKTKESKARQMPSWTCSPEEFGFGKGVNVVLTELTRRCCPAAHEAAAARQRANSLFVQGKYAEAAEAYTDAISGSPFADIVLHCNRSAARLKLNDVTGAIADGEAAVALSSHSAAGPGGPMWAKAWFRLGHALLSGGEHDAEALFSLALSTAPSPAKPPQQLVEATSSLLGRAKQKGSSPEAADGLETLKEVRNWLKQGTCPSIQSRLPSSDAHSLGSFQLGLDGGSSPGGTERMTWVREQLECALCLGLLCEPATIPCGHTVCRSCLARTLDHAFDTKPMCPMCRKDLSTYLAWLNARAVEAGLKESLSDAHGGAQIPVNKKIDSILLRHFPAESSERKEQILKEEAAAGDDTTEGISIEVPIFVCSLAMPSVACPLHIFEPRYRLMMRRCIESGQRQFGMCLFPEAEFGTMLRILEFNQLPDGRSQIKTIGTRRFQVLRWGTKDGYATGHIRWIDDVEEAAPQGESMTESDDQVSPGVRKLRAIVDTLLGHVPMGQLEHALGRRPDSTGKDGPNCPGFVFWCASLAQMPPERLYPLCYGDETRHDSAKRLEIVQAHFETKFKAMQRPENLQSDDPGEDPPSDDAGEDPE